MRASQTVHSQLPTRSDRLDSLPFGREHRKLLVGSGVGWALDAMDVGLISYVMAALVAEWSLSKTQASWLGSIGFVGMIIGTSVGGLLANKWGRRNVFALTLLTYGIATGAAVFSVGLVILLILRFNVGVGLGVELPVASTLVSEFAPCKNRGCIVVALESFWAVGWIMPALLGYFLVPKEWGGWPGWRWALLVGIVQVGPSRYLVPVCGVARLPHGWCGCLLNFLARKLWSIEDPPRIRKESNPVKVKTSKQVYFELRVRWNLVAFLFPKLMLQIGFVISQIYMALYVKNYKTLLGNGIKL